MLDSNLPDESSMARLYREPEDRRRAMWFYSGCRRKMAWLVNANAASFNPSMTRSPT